MWWCMCKESKSQRQGLGIMPTAAGIRFPQDNNQLFIFIIMLNSKVLALSIDQIMLIHFLFFYTSSLVAGPRILGITDVCMVLAYSFYSMRTEQINKGILC